MSKLTLLTNLDYNTLDQKIESQVSEAKSYTDNALANFTGADAVVNEHNVAIDAHADIRGIVDELSNTVDDKADKNDIPTKTSELTNDSNFITSESVPVKSVNGKIGEITLTASDVGADASGTAENLFAEAKNYVDEKVNDELKSNYDLWLSVGYEGTVADFIEFLRGDSAYEIWLKQEGNEGKTDEDFLVYLNNAKTYVDSHNISETAHSDIRTLISSGDASTLASAKSYTDESLANFSGAEEVVGTHNTSTEAHSDIRLLVSNLSTKVNNFLNVDDTTKDQLSEIIALIEDNADDIESITSGKVNVADIVDNLTTNVTNQPLSASQGVALKGLIDTLESSTQTKYDNAVAHSDANLETAKGYADGLVESYSSNLQAEMAENLETAKTYSDTNLKSAKNYSDTNFTNMKKYVDSLNDTVSAGITSANEAIEQKSRIEFIIWEEND